MSLTSRITEAVEKMGYKVDSLSSPLHSIGLPKGDNVAVKTDWSPVDGAQIALVTPRSVQRWTLMYPTAHASWTTRGPAQTYNNLMELERILNDMTRQPVAECWGKGG